MHRPWLQDIDYNKRILEIGPLNRPNISKSDGKNVYYADIKSTDDVIAFYERDPDIDTNTIVNIDYVIKNTYTESLRDIERFDYIVMTHVIEHIPDLIAFFNDVANVLNPDGKICLAIPDKRYCFDYFKMPTSFAEMYDVYYSNITNNPMRVLEHIITVQNHTEFNNTPYWWSNPGKYDFLQLLIKADNGEAFRCYEAAKKGEYIDTHFSIFTPVSFLLAVFFMTQCSLFPYKIIMFHNTEIDTHEFNVVLEKCPELLTDKMKREAMLYDIIELLNSCSDEKQNTDLKKKCDELSRQLADIYNSKTWKTGNMLARIFRVFIPGKKV